MKPPIGVHQCYYLFLNSPPRGFASKRAELVHINQQITSLDTHISQLSALREALRSRSRQLHNFLSPIHTLPVEVLLYIFQQLIDPNHDYGAYYHFYRQRLAQALVLSSISPLFRRVAFDTSKLWTNIPLCLINSLTISDASSLVQHCIALVSSVNISVVDGLNEERARFAADVLLTPDVTRKVRSFELYESKCGSVWVDKLEGSSFSVLD